MRLPEPNFIDRNADAITREWIDLYEKKTGKKLQPAQLERLLIDVGVYRENLLRIKMQETAKQNLVNFATYPVLDYLGELVGVYRLDATFSKTIIRFYILEHLDFDITIPAGIEVETKDAKVIFKTIKTVILEQNTEFVEVEAVANIAGVAGNGYLAGEVNNLIKAVKYIEKAENVETTFGGADREGEEQLRQRIKEAPEQFSNAGSKGAYRFHTKSAHPSITDVAVITKQAGIVEIYPLTKVGIPSDEYISIVQEHLSDDKVRPLTDLVLVKPPEKIDFAIKATLTLYTWADLESVNTQVEAEINKYIENLKSKLGKDIVPTQIIAILNSIYGVYKVELESPYYQALEVNQWANCTHLNFTIGSYING